MVRLRLQRFGRRNRPFYRLNAIEKRNRRNGKVLEQLGWCAGLTAPRAEFARYQLALKTLVRQSLPRARAEDGWLLAQHARVVTAEGVRCFDCGSRCVHNGVLDA